MPLDPYLAQKAELLRGLSWDTSDGPTIAAAATEFYQDPDGWTSPAVTWENINVTGPHGPVPVRVYRPAEPGRGLIMWAHGGGFAAGDLEMAESHIVSLELAHRTGATVIAVDYRLAGAEHRFPVPVDDVQTAWQWARSALIPDAEWAALGGASAGAAIALSTALRERHAEGAPDYLLLAYPCVHFPIPAPPLEVSTEMSSLPTLLRFSAQDIEGMVRVYVGGLTDIPREALPGAAALDGLPPTLVIIDEYDDLRGSAELLLTQLEESNVQAQRYLALGMLHGHLNRTPVIPEVERTLTRMTEFLSRP